MTHLKPNVGDVITNGYDTGEVLKVTASWVLIDSEERDGERWIHADALRAWWEVPLC